jgi:hypothetical protein
MVKNTVGCVKEILNWSSFELSDKFDNPKFNPKKFMDKMIVNSPKLTALIENINALDAKDYKNDKKLYKHYIFSDLKKSHGVKLLISAFISTGYRFCLEKSGSRLKLNQSMLDSKDESKFLVLSSSTLWGNSFTPKNIKDTLEVFNNRSDNVYGDKCRFIIIDSGFKEGIDLFDVKYAHIFEEQFTNADMSQALGRGLRNCGQKGLPFIKGKGWELQAFVYSDTFVMPKNVANFKFLNKEKSIVKYLKEKDPQLIFNETFTEQMESIMKNTAVDRLLTDKIHNLKKKSSWSLTEIAKVAIPAAIIGTAIGLKAYRAYKIYKVKKSLRYSSFDFDGNLIV